MELSTDNTGARALSYNPEHHEKVKHVERCHFFVRECVENHQLSVPFVSTVDNFADFFTKPLQGANFYSLRNKIMNWESAHDRTARARTCTAGRFRVRPSSC